MLRLLRPILKFKIDSSSVKSGINSGLFLPPPPNSACFPSNLRNQGNLPVPDPRRLATSRLHLLAHVFPGFILVVKLQEREKKKGGESRKKLRRGGPRRGERGVRGTQASPAPEARCARVSAHVPPSPRLSNSTRAICFRCPAFMSSAWRPPRNSMLHPSPRLLFYSIGYKGRLDAKNARLPLASSSCTARLTHSRWPPSAM